MTKTWDINCLLGRWPKMLTRWLQPWQNRCVASCFKNKRGFLNIASLLSSYEIYDSNDIIYIHIYIYKSPVFNLLFEVILVLRASELMCQVCSEELALEAEVEETLQCLDEFEPHLFGWIPFVMRFDGFPVYLVLDRFVVPTWCH